MRCALRDSDSDRSVGNSVGGNDPLQFVSPFRHSHSCVDPKMLKCIRMLMGACICILFIYKVTKTIEVNGATGFVNRSDSKQKLNLFPINTSKQKMSKIFNHISLADSC